MKEMWCVLSDAEGQILRENKYRMITMECSSNWLIASVDAIEWNVKSTDIDVVRQYCKS